MTAGNCSVGDFSTPLRSARNDRVGMGAMVIHDGRKLFAKGFSFEVTPMCFMTAGNCSVGDFSTPLRFARNDRDGMGAMVIHDGRKLLANGFLSGVAPICFIAIGNCSVGGFSTPLEMTGAAWEQWCFMMAGNCMRIVSCLAWGPCDSWRQETVR
jgi:hypothetical protein